MSLEEELRVSIQYNAIDRVRQILSENPSLNVNTLDSDLFSERPPLHDACERGHAEIAALLLAHPGVNVNQRDGLGRVPLYWACQEGRLEVVKLLLCDPRVDCNIADNSSQTSLWIAASWNNHVSVVQWMVALHGATLDLETKGKWTQGKYSPSEIALREHFEDLSIHELLDRLHKDRAATQRAVRIELGLSPTLEAELFAVIVFLCDDLLKLVEPSTEAVVASSAETTTGLAVRFFLMAKRLPMELQMMLCHRLQGSAKDHILSKDSEEAFKLLAQKFLS